MKDRAQKKVKLIDFGLAKIIPPGEIVRAIMGTPEFVGNLDSFCCYSKKDKAYSSLAINGLGN